MGDGETLAEGTGKLSRMVSRNMENAFGSSRTWNRANEDEVTLRLAVLDKLPTYTRKFDILPFTIRVDYSPCYVDLAALSGGKYVELVNLFPWKAYESISDGLGKSAAALVQTPLKRYQRGAGVGSALATSVQAAPAAAIAPASGAARAVHCALLGVRNSLDLERKKESIDKYSGTPHPM